MNIIILTSKNHLYANYILNRLFASGFFKDHQTTIVEQDCIIPGYSSVAGIVRYVKTSGIRYVAGQALKQKIFIVLRFLAFIGAKKDTPVFPYWCQPNVSFSRITRHNLGSKKSVAWLKKLTPDMILSVYSKEFLPPAVLDLPRIGCVNVHPAPLPAYKGVSPTFWCLSEGAPCGGTTLHRMDKKIDSGTIISRKTVLLETIKTEHELYLRCSDLAVKMLLDFLRSPANEKFEPADSEASDLVSMPESYRSLPTREAIKHFYDRQLSFFTIRELFALLKNRSHS